MAGNRSGINRGFMWLRKVLEITEETESPQVLGEVAQPIIDVFGWDRLGEQRDWDSSGAAAPASTVLGPVTPDGVLRLVTHASLVHTDTGVDHILWIDKVREPAAQTVGIFTFPLAVPINVDVALDRFIQMEQGSLLRGRADIALVAGALVLDIEFIDLPIGEYVP